MNERTDDISTTGSQPGHNGGIEAQGSAPGGHIPGFREDAGESLARATTGIASIVEHLSDAARAEAAVGPVENVGGRTLVPLGNVRVTAGWGLGFGGGGGAYNSENQGGGSGGGAGGGGTSSSKIVAVAEVSEDGLRMRPVPDVTTLGLGLMALLAVRMLTRGGGIPAVAQRVARGRLFGMLRRQ